MASILLASGVTALGWEGVALNDYTRLGQRFSVTYAFDGLTVIVPSWLDHEGGLTLTLWESPDRGKKLAEQSFTDISDNAGVELHLARSLPAGSYFWEIHDRVGETKVGLYGETQGAASEDCAYFNGVPDLLKRFRFSTNPGPQYQTLTEDLIAALGPGSSSQGMTDACRDLAVKGGKEAVPALSRLLADEHLSHMARYALEGMPDPEAGAALRQALKTLKGRLLVGVINSVGERRDTKAIRTLSVLLKDPDLEVSSASAVALGKVGSCSSARVLRRARVGSDLQPWVWEGLLICGERLMKEGHARRARGIYDQMIRDSVTGPILEAALRGAMVARQVDAVPWILKNLCSQDPVRIRSALWVMEHELPGDKVTLGLSKAMSGLNPEDRTLLARGLCIRGDPVALASIVPLLKDDNRALRLAIVQALPRMSGGSEVPALIEAVKDSDAEVSMLAREALASQPGREVVSEVMSLLESSENSNRRIGFELASACWVPEAASLLMKAVQDPDPEIRKAAWGPLQDLARPEDIPGLMGLLAGSSGTEDLPSLEGALRGAIKKAGPSDERVEGLIALLPPSPKDLQLVLLRHLQVESGPKACQAVQDFLQTEDPEIKSTVLRLLAEWNGPEAAPILLTLARDAGDPEDRILCLRGLLRLASLESVSQDQRLSLCREASPLVSRDEEKKLFLGALGGLIIPEALDLAIPHMDNPGLNQEACQAILKIAEALSKGSDLSKASQALRKVVETSGNADLTRRAQALLSG